MTKFKNSFSVCTDLAYAKCLLLVNCAVFVLAGTSGFTWLCVCECKLVVDIMHL